MKWFEIEQDGNYRLLNSDMVEQISVYAIDDFNGAVIALRDHNGECLANVKVQLSIYSLDLLSVQQTVEEIEDDMPFFILQIERNILDVLRGLKYCFLIDTEDGTFGIFGEGRNFA